MAAISLIRFIQGANISGAGEALVGVGGTDVFVENGGDNSSVGSWRIELAYGPVGSSFERIPGSPLLLAEDAAGSTPGASWNPEVGEPGCYRIIQTVWTGTNFTGTADIDIRNFAVLTPNISQVLPPFQKLPDPLPRPETFLLGAKPDELNFEGQPWGWSGPTYDYATEFDSFRLLNAALLYLDGVSSGGGGDADMSAGRYQIYGAINFVGGSPYDNRFNVLEELADDNITVVDNTMVVAQSGKYAISLVGAVYNTSTENPKDIPLQVFKNITNQFVAPYTGTTRYGADPVRATGIAGGTIVVELEAGDALFIWPTASSSTTTISGYFSIQLLKAPASSGGSTTGGNVGGGARVFRDLTGSTMNFRTFAASNSISVGEVGDTISIDGSALLPRDGSRSMTSDLNFGGFYGNAVGGIVNPGTLNVQHYAFPPSGSPFLMPSADGPPFSAMLTDGAGTLYFGTVPGTDVLVYETMVDLRADVENLPVGKLVRTKTFDEQGDGGGGDWDIVDIGSYVHNGGTVITAASSPTKAAVRRVEGVYYWEWFGAKPDGSDTTAAVQGTINAIPVTGGTSASIHGGTFTFQGMLNFFARGSITFDVSGVTMIVDCDATVLRFIEARATGFFRMIGPGYITVNEDFVGTVIDLSGPAGATFFYTLDSIYLTGNNPGQAHNSAICIDVEGVVWGAARNIVIAGGVIGVQGRDEARHGYANVILWESCTWQGQTGYAVKEFGDSWTFSNCTGEPSSTAGADRFYAAQGFFGLLVENGWFGDDTSDGAAWWQFDSTFYGAAFVGNQFYSSSVNVRVTGYGEGLLFAGNSLYSPGPELIPALGVLSGVAFIGNAQSGQTTYGGAGVIVQPFNAGNYAQSGLYSDGIFARQYQYGGLDIRGTWVYGPMPGSEPFARISLNVDDGGVTPYSTTQITPNMHPTVRGTAGVNLAIMGPDFKPKMGLFVRHDGIFPGSIPFVLPHLKQYIHAELVPPPAEYYGALTIISDGDWGFPQLAICDASGAWRGIGQLGQASSGATFTAFIEVTGDYTLTAEHVKSNTVIYCYGDTDRTITVPSNLVENIPLGRALHFKDQGTGRLQVVAGPNVIIDGSNGRFISAGPGASFSLTRVAPVGWLLEGDLVALDITALPGLVALYEPEGIQRTGTTATGWVDSSGNGNDLLPLGGSGSWVQNWGNTGSAALGNTATVMMRANWVGGPLTGDTRIILVTGWNSGLAIAIDGGNASGMRRIGANSGGTGLGVGFDTLSAGLGNWGATNHQVFDVFFDRATPADSYLTVHSIADPILNTTFTPGGTPQDFDGISIGGVYSNNVWWTSNPIAFVAVFTEDHDDWTKDALHQILLTKFRVYYTA